MRRGIWSIVTAATLLGAVVALVSPAAPEPGERVERTSSEARPTARPRAKRRRPVWRPDHARAGAEEAMGHPERAIVERTELTRDDADVVRGEVEAARGTLERTRDALRARGADPRVLVALDRHVARLDGISGRVGDP